jgi:hypothetical protein
MFLIPLMIAIFLFCPETTYIRSHIYDTDVLRTEHLSELADIERKAHTETTQVESNDLPSTPIPQKKTFVQSLAIYTGSYTDDNLFKLLAAPFVTLLNSAALYTCVTSGVLQAWYVGTAIIQTQLFAAPPYLLDAAQIGYLSVGPLLGGTLGSVLVALLSDPLAKWATTRNNGI